MLRFGSGYQKTRAYFLLLMVIWQATGVWVLAQSLAQALRIPNCDQVSITRGSRIPWFISHVRIISAYPSCSKSEGIEAYFFYGLDAAKAKYYKSTFTTFPIFRIVPDNDICNTLPCIYLAIEDDQALPTAYQEGMIVLRVDDRIIYLGATEPEAYKRMWITCASVAL